MHLSRSSLSNFLISVFAFWTGDLIPTLPISMGTGPPWFPFLLPLPFLELEERIELELPCPRYADSTRSASRIRSDNLEYSLVHRAFQMYDFSPRA